MCPSGGSSGTDFQASCACPHTHFQVLNTGTGRHPVRFKRARQAGMMGSYAVPVADIMPWDNTMPGRMIAGPGNRRAARRHPERSGMAITQIYTAYGSRDQMLDEAVNNAGSTPRSGRSPDTARPDIQRVVGGGRRPRVSTGFEFPVMKPADRRFLRHGSRHDVADYRRCGDCRREPRRAGQRAAGPGFGLCGVTALSGFGHGCAAFIPYRPPRCHGTKTRYQARG